MINWSPVNSIFTDMNMTTTELWFLPGVTQIHPHPTLIPLQKHFFLTSCSKFRNVDSNFVINEAFLLCRALVCRQLCQALISVWVSIVPSDFTDKSEQTGASGSSEGPAHWGLD